jgi:hypothetical protein
MAAINFPTAASTPSRTTYTLEAPWTDSVNGGEWWFNSTKVRWMPVVAGGASDFGDLGGVPADNTALADALALKAPLISPLFTDDITVKPPGFVVQSLTLAPNPSTGFLHYATPQGGHIRFKATYSDSTATNDYTFPDATGTIALTSEIPNDYGITSAQGRQLIASLKTVWPVSGSLAGILYFATTKVAAGTFTVRTTTGYARVIDHRGILAAQVGTGSATSDISLALPQANVGQRAYAVISVASGGSVRSGDITRLTTNSNEVTVIDVASTTALTYLLCYGNQLTELDVSANTALTILDCNTNQLTTLDVSTNTALTNLTCGTNQLTTLDVGANTLLTSLSCSSNLLTTLDVGANTLLTSFSCSTNQLPTAVVDQILVDLDSLNVDGNGVYLNGTGNGAASATGIAAAAGLVTDGWTPVVYN